MSEAPGHRDATPGGFAPVVQPQPFRARGASRDGLRNRIEAALLAGRRLAWQFVNCRPALAWLCNRVVVNNAVLKAPARPLALSKTAYASWPSLNDCDWFDRYLLPRTAADLPLLDAILALFKPGLDSPRVSQRSTLLFPSFAQWFTDGFLMTDDADRRRTTTNHQIDLSRRHGLRSEAPGQKGRLKSGVAGGEEWAPRLHDAARGRNAEFAALPGAASHAGRLAGGEAGWARGGSHPSAYPALLPSPSASIIRSLHHAPIRPNF